MGRCDDGDMEERRGRGAREVVLPDPGTAIRWHTHGYPGPLSRWHHHPEVEFHLIRTGTGLMMAGDAMMPFEEGQIALIGSDVPHNWISDLGPGQVLPERDVVCQVRPELLVGLAGSFPETAHVRALLDRAAHGIVLAGESAGRARTTLESMGSHSPLRRLADVIEMLDIFAEAPRSEWSTVVTPGFVPDHSPDAAERVNTALAFIEDHLANDLHLADAADTVGMSPSAFSRFFRRTTGIGFSDLVTCLRVSRACGLLTSTDLPVARIQAEAGYANASNFNRRFRAQTGTTPLAYRLAHSLDGC